jgi:hypothetical protein
MAGIGLSSPVMGVVYALFMAARVALELDGIVCK